MRMNIALDGASGTGKSSTAKAVAEKLGIIYLDTGAMFRAIAYKAVLSDIDSKDVDGIVAMLDGTDVDIKYDNGKMLVYLDGNEVSGHIRENKVSMMASNISAYKEVREKLITLQRQIAENNDVILDGRDIGTVVLPNAKYKFFLVANSHVRAIRRHAELLEKGEDVPVEQIQKELELRDYNDSTRAIAPLKKADNAVEIDTATSTLDEVVAKIINIVGENK